MGVLEGGNTLFLNVSCGFLVNKKKEISTRGYEGLFKSISREPDEFEGKAIDKIKLHMTDHKTGDEAVISFTAESWYCIGFFQRIEKIDLSKPFIVGVSQSDKNEKISFCWMKQGGHKIEKLETFPLPEKVKVGKTEVMNWEPVNNTVDFVIEKINKIEYVSKVEPEGKTKEDFVTEPIDDASDLPF